MSDKPGVSTEKKHPHILQDEINALFKSEWQPWVGGILIGIISVLMYAYSRPWGVALGVRNWGEWMLYPLGVVKSAPPSPLSFTTSVTNLSLIYGSFVASLLAGQFALRMPNLRDSLRGVFGGVLMGIGAALGMGCTIGGFYTSFISLSLAGPLMMAGLLMGAYLGLKLLIWDISREPAFTAKPQGKKRTFKNLQPYQPLIGAAVLALTVVWLLADKTEFTSRGVSGLRSILIMFGMALGFISQRSRFCFSRSFREPFMTGDGSMTKAVVLAILIGLAGFSIIKGTDLADYRDPAEFVNPSVWIGSLTGGLIFGIGMIFAGGCASGSMWRAGEGQVKLWLVLVVFSATMASFSLFLQNVANRRGWGEKAVFLPTHLGWMGAILLLVGLSLLWYLFAAWMEKRSGG